MRGVAKCICMTKINWMPHWYFNNGLADNIVDLYLIITRIGRSLEYHNDLVVNIREHKVDVIIAVALLRFKRVSSLLKFTDAGTDIANLTRVVLRLGPVTCLEHSLTYNIPYKICRHNTACIRVVVYTTHSDINIQIVRSIAAKMHSFQLYKYRHKCII